jgi:HEPN domain-containing protein
MKLRIRQSDLDFLAKERLLDAEMLYKSDRYDGAIYLCGYVLEYTLKSYICKHNGWIEFTPLSNSISFTIHSLDELLKLSGKENDILQKVNKDWLFVKNIWDPSNRYSAKKYSEADCLTFIECTKTVIKEIRA